MRTGRMMSGVLALLMLAGMAAPIAAQESKVVAAVSGKAALKAGSLSASISSVPGVKRDGTIDNTIVAHEWGHYLHHRANQACNNQACGAESEGWGDFLALHMLVREGDAHRRPFPDELMVEVVPAQYAITSG